MNKHLCTLQKAPMANQGVAPPVWLGGPGRLLALIYRKGLPYWSNKWTATPWKNVFPSRNGDSLCIFGVEWSHMMYCDSIPQKDINGCGVFLVVIGATIIPRWH